MKNIIQLFIFAFFPLYYLSAQPADHVVLISIDGLKPEFYMDPQWGMKNLNMVMIKGSYAEKSMSVFPSLTLPAHTSMVTGVLPDQHGIYYNSPFRPTRYSNEWYWYYKDIETPTLWDALMQDSNMTTAAVNWPVTVGAPIDYNIPVISKTGEKTIDLISKYSTPSNFLKEVEINFTGTLDEIDLIKQGDYLAQDYTMARISSYIIMKYKPNLIAIRLACVDYFQHRDGIGGELLKLAISGVDRDIHTIIEAVERAGLTDRTTFIITGDHGHVEKRLLFAPNVLLKDAGYIGDLKNNEWSAQFKAGSTGSAFLYLKDFSDKETLNGVMKLLNTQTDSIRNMFEVIMKPELLNEGVDPTVSLALTSKSGFGFSDAVTGEILRSSKGSGHGNSPTLQGMETGFIIFGAGIEKNKIIPVVGIIDVAPIISHLLGIDFLDINKKVIMDIFE